MVPTPSFGARPARTKGDAAARCTRPSSTGRASRPAVSSRASGQAAAHPQLRVGQTRRRLERRARARRVALPPVVALRLPRRTIDVRLSRAPARSHLRKLHDLFARRAGLHRRRRRAARRAVACVVRHVPCAQRQGRARSQVRRWQEVEDALHDARHVASRRLRSSRYIATPCSARGCGAFERSARVA